MQNFIHFKHMILMHFHPYILLAIKLLINYSTNHRVFLFHDNSDLGNFNPSCSFVPSTGRSITCIIRFEFRIQKFRIEARDQEIHVRLPALAVITNLVAVYHSSN